MKNIGGSILPSSSPEILKPLKFKSAVWAGNLQVTPNEKKDTHELFLINGDERQLLASHPNGFSCFELAKRMAARERMRSCEQATYIIACGGSVTALGASLSL